MIDFIFLIIYFLFPLLFVYYSYKINQKIISFSATTMVILSMFVYAYSGILPLYFGWDQYRYEMGVQDKYLIFNMLIYSIISITGLVLGFSYIKFYKKIKIRNFKNIRSLSMSELYVLIILMILCFLVLVIYIKKIQNIALFVVLENGPSLDSQLARSLMGNDFSGRYHWYKLIFSDLLSVITFSLFCAFLLQKNLFLLSIFIVSFSMLSFSSIMATEKAVFAEVLIGLIFSYALTNLKNNIKITQIILFLIILFLSLSLFYIYFMGSKDIFSAFYSIFSRALSGSIQPAYYYLEYFPQYNDFLMGKSFPNPGGFLPFSPFPLTIEIAEWTSPSEYGIVSTMPTVFWAEAYANFGVLGVIFMPPIMGVIIYVACSLLSKLEDTPIKMGFYTWMVLHFTKISISGFSDFVLDFYLFIVTFIIISAISFSNKYKIRYYA